MHEKGPGKWTLQGRSRDELANQLPPGEARPLDLTTPTSAGLPWGWIAAATAALVAGLWIALG